MFFAQQSCLLGAMCNGVLCGGSVLFQTRKDKYFTSVFDLRTLLK